MDNTQQHTNREFQCLSLCTGYRGIERGLDIAGVRHRTIAYVEIEAFAIANLVAEMEKSTLCSSPIWTDIKTFDALPFRGKVDIITGGYPCQPFSSAGLRKGSEDARHLWPYISEIVRAIKPIYCFFENVEGHLTMGYAEVYRSLSDMGYTVEAGIFSSIETSGSHQRKRLFILAKLADSNLNDECDNTGEVRESTKGIKEEEQRKEWNNIQRQRSGAEFSPANSESELANSNCTGLPVKTCGWIKGFYGKVESFKRSQFSRISSKNRIPIAPPGPFQYEWEDPRQSTKDALKSRLGLSTTNRYDYRTDLLRSLGNGVDPFTAAKAWKVLNEEIKIKYSN